MSTPSSAPDSTPSHHSHSSQQEASSPSLSVLGQIQPFTLQSTTGQQVSLDKDLQAKTKLVYFFYTNCPDVCPITTKRMENMLQLMKQQNLSSSDVKLISITLDPKRDTQEAIQQFSKKYKVDPAYWFFLRGDAEQTKSIMNQFHADADELPSGMFMHSDRMYLLDDKNQLRATYVMGTDVKDEDVVNDVKKLLGK
ncbi:hypothetical protein skT53_16120 [Effusibacillus dendaii]|uniref:Thioredoxin domain-containing protein n=2 Tax=Effusibacillus dendaii TaxID=2743772 RepID=A0A7I8D9E9_9BACL|nr:hypothetical protein skT53_16120 [Effusibacillus dendaii]